MPLPTLAFGDIDLPGVVVCGLIFGMVFGVPLSLIRALLPGGRRLRRFSETLVMSVIGGWTTMFLLWIAWSLHMFFAERQG
jgi:ABC-type multidrug transport system permease subunit